MSTNFRGAGVALITPFKSNLAIDFEALGRIVENQIKNKIDYLVVLGTTAETATLNNSEKQQVIDFVAKQVNGRIPIVVGIGSNDTQAVLESIQSLDLSKADAISKKVIATKEASGNIGEITKILRDKPDGFSVISGDDGLLLPIIALGGVGVISVAANAIPKSIADLTHFALDGDFKQAAKIHLRLQSFCESLFVEGNPAGAKAALHSQGVSENVLRLPLVPVGAATYKILADEMRLLS
ncbi:MAG: dihydrodipicolinate synthase family protein [Bacteroidia bacterium]|nr:dihydrodipicolinate synthase family protein [Bacteroidia bacterium]